MGNKNDFIIFLGVINIIGCNYMNLSISKLKIVFIIGFILFVIGLIIGSNGALPGMTGLFIMFLVVILKIVYLIKPNTILKKILTIGIGTFLGIFMAVFVLAILFSGGSSSDGIVVDNSDIITYTYDSVNNFTSIYIVTQHNSTTKYHYSFTTKQLEKLEQDGKIKLISEEHNGDYSNNAVVKQYQIQGQLNVKIRESMSSYGHDEVNNEPFKGPITDVYYDVSL
jgi:hypothetical protein